jgi:hypothetical protein
MDLNELKEALKQNIKIETGHKDNRLVIILKWGDEVISSDFIDYSEVVRIVNNLGLLN